jgi:hypothetical protein
MANESARLNPCLRRARSALSTGCRLQRDLSSHPDPIPDRIQTSCGCSTGHTHSDSNARTADAAYTTSRSCTARLFPSRGACSRPSRSTACDASRAVVYAGVCAASRCRSSCCCCSASLCNGPDEWVPRRRVDVECARNANQRACLQSKVWLRVAPGKSGGGLMGGFV